MATADDFPNLTRTNHRVTSPASREYNCIAWAAGEQDCWWWPDGMDVYFWPLAAPREETIKAFVAAFATRGFTRCENGEVEAGYHKIAIYAKNSRPTHAARQLPDGRWTSKLGSSEDIEHHTLGAVEGDVYGSVAVFVRRFGA